MKRSKIENQQEKEEEEKYVEDRRIFEGGFCRRISSES